MIGEARKAEGPDQEDVIAACEILKAAMDLNFAGHRNRAGLTVSACAIVAGIAYMEEAIARTHNPDKAERRRMAKHLEANFAAGMTVAKNRALRQAREAGETFQ